MINQITQVQNPISAQIYKIKSVNTAQLLNPSPHPGWFKMRTRATGRVFAKDRFQAPHQPKVWANHGGGLKQLNRPDE